MALVAFATAEEPPMNSDTLAPKLKLQKSPNLCDRPKGRQGSAVYGHATYSYKKGTFIYRVEGVIYDLWETGCSIRGTTPQLVGSRIRIILSLNDQQPPLCVKGAMVSWFAGETFGLKFPQLKVDDVTRLREHASARSKPVDM